MNRLCYYYYYSCHHYHQSSKLALYQVVRLYSNNNQHEWRSKTNVIITNPTMLTMESCSTMHELKQIHAHMTRTGLITHTFPASRVLAFCALSSSGDIRYARALFAQIESPNAYMWNTMMRGCSRSRIPAAAFGYFVRMVRDGVDMNGLSFVFALKACEKVSDGDSVCCVMRKMGLASDLLARNGLIRFYAERGSLVDARKVFGESPVRDVVTWTTVIDGYAKMGSWDEALAVFESMLFSGVEPNEVTMISVLAACGGKGDIHTAKKVYNYLGMKAVNRSLNLLNSALDMFAKCGLMVEAKEIFYLMKAKDVFSWTTMIDGYAKSGELGNARSLFDEMPEKNEVSWNAMIAGYSQNDRPGEALDLFRAMRTKGFAPTDHTLVCILSSCGQLGRLDLGRRIHHRYAKEPRHAISVSNALVDMYAKCGSIDEAAAVFAGMSHRRNPVSWNAMISGYAMHGRTSEALILFERMKLSGLRPDRVTFVAVLSACSHGGMVSEGRDCFETMARDFGVSPGEEHYACMVDLLSRNGLVQEAYDFIRAMPMEPGKSSWGALLNASKIHGDVEMAELSARRLLDLDPNDSGVYVLLATAMAGGRRWCYVRKVRREMRENGVKKSPGHSLIEIEGEFHEFLVGDRSHSRSREIYKVLNDVYAMISNLEDCRQNMSRICEQDYGYPCGRDFPT